jgi:hypothetical protein
MSAHPVHGMRSATCSALRGNDGVSLQQQWLRVRHVGAKIDMERRTQ